MNIKAFNIFILICLSLQSYTQTVYIRAGRLFDGNQFLGGRVITINNGLIQEIYEESYQIPDSSYIIDASNCTVLPGLIDSHIHFMGAPMPYLSEIEKHSWGKLASEGISLFPEHRLHLLKNGITSIIDMGAPLKSYKKISKTMRKGKIVGPELYYPGPLITSPKGHPAGTFYTGQHDLILNGTFQVTEVAKARKEVEFLANQKVDFIKIVYDRMWYLKGGAPRLDLEVAKGIVERIS